MLRTSLRRLAGPLVALLLFSAPTQAGLISGLLNTVIRLVDGTVGTVLDSGMWTVEVPSGAFTGTASVSVGTSARDPLTCELGITPLEKNNFSKPVMLTAHLRPGMLTNTTGVDGSREEIMIGSVTDPVRNTVSAPLWHFSTYRVGGRNGW